MPAISSAAAGIAGDADQRAVASVSFVFEVVRHRGHWRTLHCAKHSAPFPDQAAAILAAKKLARNKRDLGHAVEVILRRTDGASVVQPVDGDECLSTPA
jgi:hypothetical protein